MNILKSPCDSFFLNDEGDHMNAYSLEFRKKSKKTWDSEYRMEPTIPSSHRTNPSHALIKIENDINYTNAKVLDLGCGNGRNSIYMANKGAGVFSLDFSIVAINILKENLSKSISSLDVKVKNVDICDGLPFSDESFDIVLDSYCLCHFLDVNSAVMAMRECKRILKAGGKLIKIHLTNEDEYYKERIEREINYGHISRDPVNNIRKSHFNIESYKKYIATDFKIMKTETIEFIDQVRDKEYVRNIFISILEK